MKYVNILIKKWWIILLFAVIGVAAATYYTYKNYTPIYTSSSTLLIVNSEYKNDMPITYADLLAGQQLVKEYREIILSRDLLKTVADELKLYGLTEGEVRQNVSVELKEDTRIIIINAYNKVPARAKQIVDKTCENFINKVKTIANGTKVAVIDLAEVPTAPASPEHKRKILLGLLAGIISALGVVFLLEELDDSIKSVEDVEKTLGLKVLGTIPNLNIK